MNETWRFADPKNVAVITTKQVMREHQPILFVSHDADDGAWQFHTGEPVDEDDAMIVGLARVVELDKSLYELADLPLGWSAWRESVGQPWQREER